MEHKVELCHIGGITATVEKLSGILVDMVKASGCSACLEFVKNKIFVSLQNYASIHNIDICQVGKISCEIIYTPDAEVIVKYLEIEPKILWVYPDFEVSNNVYSNTEWVIN